MNPLVTAIRPAPRGVRGASPARDRSEGAGFEQALDAAAAAAQPPVRPESPRPAPEENATPREAADPGTPTASEESPTRGNEARPDEAASRADGRDRRGGTRAPGAHETARTDRPVELTSGAQPSLSTPDAASAAGTTAQNAAASPPAADRGDGLTPPPGAGTAVVVEARTPVPDAAPVAGTTEALPLATARVPAEGAPALPDAGVAQVRVLSSRSAPQPARVPISDASRTAPAPAASVGLPIPAPAEVTSATPARPGMQDAPARRTFTAPPPPDPAASREALVAGARSAVVPASPAPPQQSPAPAERPATALRASADAPAAAPATVAGGDPMVSLRGDAPSGARPATANDSRADVARAEASAVPSRGDASTTTSEPPAAAPPASDGSATARGQGDETPSRDREGGSTKDRGPAPGAGTAPADTTPTVTGEPQGPKGPGAPATAAPVRENTAATAARTLEDPRLEPMRRAADQVTLQFDGEDGLRGPAAHLGARRHGARLDPVVPRRARSSASAASWARFAARSTEQGFTQTRVAVHDTRAAGGVQDSSDPRHDTRGGEERRQGEPQRRSGQGRDSAAGYRFEPGPALSAGRKAVRVISVHIDAAVLRRLDLDVERNGVEEVTGQGRLHDAPRGAAQAPGPQQPAAALRARRAAGAVHERRAVHAAQHVRWTSQTQVGADREPERPVRRCRRR